MFLDLSKLVLTRTVIILCYYILIEEREQRRKVYNILIEGGEGMETERRVEFIISMVTILEGAFF